MQHALVHPSCKRKVKRYEKQGLCPARPLYGMVADQNRVGLMKVLEPP